MMQTSNTTGDGLEKRRPRISFTRTLEKMCSKLDESNKKTVSWRDSIDPSKVCSATVEITSLWVVGSYARGALTCGDLDLVAEIAPHGRGTGAPVKKHFFGSLKDVSLYIGTPEMNSSHAQFPDATLIWQVGRDWREAIGSIPENPDAGHFARRHDAIPFRVDQLNVPVERADELMTAFEQGILSWYFVPVEHIAPALSPVTDDEKRFFTWERLGAKGRELIPYLAGHFRQQVWDGQDGWHLALDEFRHNDTRVRIGKPRVWSSMLDELSFARAAIFPHLSRRGPNGIWMIERGDQHPLVQAAAKVEVWGITGDGVHPTTIDDSTEDGASKKVLQLFGTASDAAEVIAWWGDEASTSYKPIRLSGRDLLYYLAQFSYVELDGTLTASKELLGI